MAEAIGGVDTSSYPKPAIPTSPLDIAGKLGTIQSQKLDIDQKKLSQANEAMQYLSRSITAIGPNGTPEQYLKAGQDAVSAGLAPPATLNIMRDKIQSDYTKTGRFDSQRFFKETMGQMAQYKDIMDFHLGNIRKDSTGANDVFSNAPGNPSEPIVQRGQLQQQEPPTQQTVDPTTNQPTTLGGGRPSPGIVPPPNRLQPSVGSTAPIVPNAVPTQSVRPPLAVGAIDPNTLPTNPFAKPGERAIQAVVQPPVPAAVPTHTAQGVPTAAPPMFEAGKKQFVEDQDLATQKLTAIKPALQALPLLKDLKTGIGTETYNKALAGLSNLGWLPQGMTDKVADYQIINKKLADYLRTNPIGQRSDAQQALSQSASPDPKGQINQALTKLIPDAIALDRAQAIRAISFANRNEDKYGNVNHSMREDFHNYGNHRSTLPANIDERALKIDLMPDNERNALLDEMKKKQNTFQGKKFKQTLELAERAGLFDTSR